MAVDGGGFDGFVADGAVDGHGVDEAPTGVLYLVCAMMQAWLQARSVGGSSSVEQQLRYRRGDVGGGLGGFDQTLAGDATWSKVKVAAPMT